MSGQLHAPAALPPGKQPPNTHWIGGWVVPRTGLDDVEKRKFFTVPGLELRPLGRPALILTALFLAAVGTFSTLLSGCSETSLTRASRLRMK
jgi:hypothetical protein